MEKFIRPFRIGDPYSGDLIVESRQVIGGVAARSYFLFDDLSLHPQVGRAYLEIL